MNIKKWLPWNWFKKEEEQGNIPVKIRTASDDMLLPVSSIEREFDRLFKRYLKRFGDFSMIPDIYDRFGKDFILKPDVDIAETDKKYTITAEIPGVEKKDISIEISDSTLVIKGEKKHEKEEKDKNYHVIERSYGAFQRILSLPEDVDEEKIEAKFENGVLKINLPKQASISKDKKVIEIK